MLPQGCLLAHFEASLDFSVANLLAHNNISQICYCGQITLQSAAVNCSFFWKSDTFGGNIYFADDGKWMYIVGKWMYIVIPCKNTENSVQIMFIAYIFKKARKNTNQC